MDRQVPRTAETVQGENSCSYSVMMTTCFVCTSAFIRVECLQETMREYMQQHPELNMTQDIGKSTLTKAERHLKDKSDGRPDKPPP